MKTEIKYVVTNWHKRECFRLCLNEEVVFEFASELSKEGIDIKYLSVWSIAEHKRIETNIVMNLSDIDIL
jgi:hypothetical protein